MIAERIIALAKQGERDPDKLCDGALKALGSKQGRTGVGKASRASGGRRCLFLGVRFSFRFQLRQFAAQFH
ncbi:MAG: hypothetical protein WBR32_13905, partial [Pseudolabrys sp.]